MPRVVVVSNRLPVTLHPDRQPPNDVELSAGGLASALRSCIASYEEALWIGWPGCVPSSEDQERLTKRLAEASASWNCRMIPVWLQQSDVDDFYTGFSNSSLWPLMHWMTTNARFKRVWAEAYRRVNEQFADVILTEATPMDLVWIHDYHLFLVPQMLRKKRDIKLVQAEAEKSGLVRLERPGHLPPELPHADADVRHVKRPEGLPSTPEDAESEAQPAAAHSTSETFEEPMSSHSPKAERHAFKSCTDRLTLLGEEEPPAEEDSAEKPGRDGYPNASTKKMRRSITQVEMASKLRIAFFLHTPFPGYEVLCVLPQCVDVVEGVLGADLVGFHTYNYLRHFRSCVIRLCGFTPDIDHVDHRGQRTHLGVFPIGANVNDIMDAMKTETFAQHLKEYTEQFQGKSLVLNVERLDYSKGLPQKLAAIQRYLEEAKKSAEDEDAQRTDRIEELQKRIDRLDKHKANRGLATSNLRRIGANVMKMLMGDFERPALETELDHNKTVFVFIAVPSRRDVEEYQKIEEEVHRSISTINGNFSTLSHQPIVYIHRGVPMPELAALYARADCCLVTPLIDGMNLVAKEFIAAKDRSIDKVVPGTVVLSELAGAAQELFDAIVVNPYDDDAVADAIAIGLELTRGNRLSEDQRWEVTERMRQSIIENDSAAWGRSMLAELENPLQGSRIARPERLAMQYLQDHCAQKFFASRPGLKALFLDYDGTLREFEAKPEDAVPTEETQEMLARLARRDDLKLYIVSGRNRDFLEKHFGELPSLTLIAEHGYFKRGPDTDGKWVEFTPYSTLDWMDKIRPVLEMFTRCTPGAYIEHKASAIVWHYRDCDEDYGQFKAKELMHQLALMLGNLPCAISQGNKIVEVASLSVRKGVVVGNAVQQHESMRSRFEEVLICGDDRTDESMFQEAPSHAYTVKVGPGETTARYRLPAPADVRHFLSLIADQSPTEESHEEGELESHKRGDQHRDSGKISRFYSFKDEARSQEKQRRLSAWNSIESVKDPDEENDPEDPLAALGETEDLAQEV